MFPDPVAYESRYPGTVEHFTDYQQTCDEDDDRIPKT